MMYNDQQSLDIREIMDLERIEIAIYTKLV
jgi:hypothetical protein